MDNLYSPERYTRYPRKNLRDLASSFIDEDEDEFGEEDEAEDDDDVGEDTLLIVRQKPSSRIRCR